MTLTNVWIFRGESQFIFSMLYNLTIRLFKQKTCGDNKSLPKQCWTLLEVTHVTDDKWDVINLNTHCHCSLFYSKFITLSERSLQDIIKSVNFCCWFLHKTFYHNSLFNFFPLFKLSGASQFQKFERNNFCLRQKLLKKLFSREGLTTKTGRNTNKTRSKRDMLTLKQFGEN